jgi:AAR2 protein
MDSSEESHDMESPKSSPKSMKSLVAMLDLPIGSVVTMDGSAIVLQRSDFVGIHTLPKSGVHAVMIRGGSCSTTERISGGKLSQMANPSSTTVGFVFQGSRVGSDDPLLVRQFDRHTEEVSSSTVDMETLENLRRQFECDQIDPHRLLAYDQVVPSSQQDVWHRLTGFISRDLLDHRGIETGQKLVPGAYCSFNEDSTSIGSDQLPPKCVDGRSVSYPPIPIFPLDARRHHGTRQFLQALTPAMRTTICCNFEAEISPSTVLLECLLNNVYYQKWESLLGDLQLAFVLFLNLQCYSSWIHWRDLLSMLSSVDSSCMQLHLELFSALFTVSSVHIETIEDKDILDGVDITEEDGFFISSLHCLLDTAKEVPGLRRSKTFIQCRNLLHDKFPEHFSADSTCESVGGNNYNTPEAVVSNDGTDAFRVFEHMPGNLDDDDDSDGPVVIAVEEVEESISRSRMLFTESFPFDSTGVVGHNRDWLRERYPLLLAAMESSSSKEDVVMTCARVLYDASDVSLVREAAAYLEEVEAKNIHF